ncbi:MAG: Cob(I)yrinic acid a,c-diamide adenosyltransferase [candidate division BRC1 bacterium ADurb.BinA364]|nr:MAG: Cob(I)yrinic acid a,c-diamide adenosyltransferase [candidate division BRC1 bacterium ADurb.BinA364]
MNEDAKAPRAPRKSVPYSPPSGPYPPQLHLYIGDGKGKTTAAVGLAARALGYGMKVDFIQFDKGGSEDDRYYERRLLRAAPGMNWIATGLERMRPGQPFRFGATDEDRREALRALALARQSLEGGGAGLVVLDEILSAVAYRLLREEEVWELAELFLARRPCELAMTGRRASPRLIEAAGLVTEMKCVKHCFESGIPARPGIDY